MRRGEVKPTSEQAEARPTLWAGKERSSPHTLVDPGDRPVASGAGVAGALADPQLDPYDSQGTKIASNDNWKGAQKAEIMASGLAPSDDRESAISISLAPAAYTAIVSGVGETSGVALVEAYNLP
jgi:hypothetical protein